MPCKVRCSWRLTRCRCKSLEQHGLGLRKLGICGASWAELQNTSAGMALPAKAGTGRCSAIAGGAGSDTCRILGSSGSWVVPNQCFAPRLPICVPPKPFCGVQGGARPSMRGAPIMVKLDALNRQFLPHHRRQRGQEQAGYEGFAGHRVSLLPSG